MAFAPASSVSLSQEILDEIVDAVAVLDAKDLSSVKACSLAARAFLPRSQYHIFAHITLSLSDHGAEEDASTCPRSDAERFINNALQSTPKLALLVRSVTLTNHNSDLDHSNGSFEKWRSDDLEYLIPSDPHLAPLFSRLRNMHTLKIDGLDLGFVDDHPFGGDASAAQVLASFSAFFRDKLITTLVLHEVGFSARKLLTELLKGFLHTRTLDFTAVFRTTMFSLEAIPTTGIPLVPDDTEDDAPIPLRNLIIGLSEVSDTELRGVLRNPYPLSLSELELLEFRDRTIHDRTYFEDIEQALEMTRSSLKTAVFNFYWIETNSPQFLSFQHLTDVRIKIHYCHPSDSVLRNGSSDVRRQRYPPRNQWRFWVRSLSQAEAYCMRHLTITVVLYFRARVPMRSIFGTSRSPSSLGLGLSSMPLLWVDGPNVNDLTALREALMRPQLRDLQSVTVLLDFNLVGSRFHPDLLPPRLQEFRDAFQPLVDARRYTFTLSVIGDQTPPPDELLSQPYKLYQREDLTDSEAEEEEEKQEEIRRLHEIIKPASTFTIRNVMIQRWIDLDPERNRYKVEFEKWISRVPEATQKKYFREEKEKRKVQKAAAGRSTKKTVKK